MARYFFFIVLVLCGALPQVTRAAPLEDAAAARSEEAAVLDQLDDAAVARLDLYCLRMAYPQIKGFADDAEGRWLLLKDGRRVLYAAPLAADAAALGLALADPDADALWDVDVRSSRAAPYPWEPYWP